MVSRFLAISQVQIFTSRNVDGQSVFLIEFDRFCYSPVKMSTNLEKLTADAMKLPLRDRVQLAQRLVSTLDNEVEADTEVLWFAEAERRLEELRNGKVQGIDSDVAFPDARQALRQ